MKLGILLLTYNRLTYAETTLRSLAHHLIWPGEIHIHIADDGSAPEYRTRLSELAGELWPKHGRSVTNAKRSGYGANFNLATQVLHQTCDVVLPLEDDWECLRPFDAGGYGEALGDEIQCVRFGYIGYTEPLRGEVRYVAGRPFLLFDEDSPERHVSAGHPRLETVAYERQIGPWAEGLDPGATEFDWCGRPPARRGVAWPMDVRPTQGDLFAHIGAEQAREDQRP